MPNNKNSRKNTKVAKPKAETTTKTNDDDDWGVASIVTKSTPSSRASTRSNKSKPESVAAPAVTPEPSVPEWEMLGMTEEDYKAMQQRVAKRMLEVELENYRKAMEADLDSLAFWERRIESLERTRERYNQKAAWTAEDLKAVQEIDAEMDECEANIARIEEMDEFEEGVAAY